MLGRGLHHLHSSGCVHADLKPPNVLWDPNIAAFKLVDFGLAYTTSERLSHAIQSRGEASHDFKDYNKNRIFGKLGTVLLSKV